MCSFPKCSVEDPQYAVLRPSQTLTTIMKISSQRTPVPVDVLVVFALLYMVAELVTWLAHCVASGVCMLARMLCLAVCGVCGNFSEKYGLREKFSGLCETLFGLYEAVRGLCDTLRGLYDTLHGKLCGLCDSVSFRCR